MDFCSHFSFEERRAMLAFVEQVRSYQKSLKGTRREKGERNAVTSSDLMDDFADEMIRDLASKGDWNADKRHYADIWTKNQIVNIFKPTTGWVASMLRQTWNMPRWESIQIEEALSKASQSATTFRL